MDPAVLLREQLDALNGGISHAMVTIVEADGSAPRKNGKMLVFENGDTLGTIGGGSAECLAAKDAMECIRRRERLQDIRPLLCCHKQHRHDLRRAHKGAYRVLPIKAAAGHVRRGPRRLRSAQGSRIYGL